MVTGSAEYFSKNYSEPQSFLKATPTLKFEDKQKRIVKCSQQFSEKLFQKNEL